MNHHSSLDAGRAERSGHFRRLFIRSPTRRLCSRSSANPIHPQQMSPRRCARLSNCLLTVCSKLTHGSRRRFGSEGIPLHRTRPRSFPVAFAELFAPATKFAHIAARRQSKPLLRGTLAPSLFAVVVHDRDLDPNSTAMFRLRPFGINSPTVGLSRSFPVGHPCSGGAVWNWHLLARFQRPLRRYWLHCSEKVAAGAKCFCMSES